MSSVNAREFASDCIPTWDTGGDVREVDYDEDEGEEVRTLLPQRTGHLVSATRTLMNFFRAEISAGCLSLPVAFKDSGLWAGLALSPFIGLFNTICSLNLVETSQHLCKKTGRTELDYGHLAKKAFDLGPERLRPHSKKALYVTNVFVSMYQIGVASVQAVFIAVNLINLLCFFGSAWIPSLRIMLTILLPFLFLLNSIRNLHFLSYLSTIGNFVILIGFVIVMQFIVRGENVINALPAYTDPTSLALYCGTMLYAYEGQAVILPMENKMKRPWRMGGWNGVLVTGMGILTAVYTAVAFYGYAKFGENTLGTITLNMPQTALYQSINVFLIVAVVLGWPLQLYVVVEMLWPPILRKFVSPHIPSRFHSWSMYAFRSSLVLVVYALGMSVSELSLLVPLVGITVGVILAFVFPPLLQLICYWDDWTTRQRKLYLTRNTIIIFAGVFVMIVGTYANILEIIKYNQSGESSAQDQCNLSA